MRIFSIFFSSTLNPRPGPSGTTNSPSRTSAGGSISSWVQAWSGREPGKLLDEQVGDHGADLRRRPHRHRTHPSVRRHPHTVAVGQNRHLIGFENSAVVAHLGLQDLQHPGVEPFLGFFDRPMHLAHGQGNRRLWAAVRGVRAASVPRRTAGRMAQSAWRRRLPIRRWCSVRARRSLFSSRNRPRHGWRALAQLLSPKLRPAGRRAR